jgi:hypothetical protein
MTYIHSCTHTYMCYIMYMYTYIRLIIHHIHEASHVPGSTVFVQVFSLYDTFLEFVQKIYSALAGMFLMSPVRVRMYSKNAQKSMWPSLSSGSSTFINSAVFPSPLNLFNLSTSASSRSTSRRQARAILARSAALSCWTSLMRSRSDAADCCSSNVFCCIREALRERCERILISTCKVAISLSSVPSAPWFPSVSNLSKSRMICANFCFGKSFGHLSIAATGEDCVQPILFFFKRLVKLKSKEKFLIDTCFFAEFSFFLALHLYIMYMYVLQHVCV